MRLYIQNTKFILSISSNCVLTVINASAAVTLLEQRPEKNSGSERDSNPRPLQCQCSALPTEVSKPHENGRMRVSPLNVDAQSLNFFQVSVLVVLRPHLH